MDKPTLTAQQASDLRALVDDAVAYVDEELAPERELVLKYYRGELPAPVEEGRSKVVMTEVRDGVQALLPSLLRVFFAPERVVEFTSKSDQPDAVRNAEIQTEYVHRVLEDNGGFLQTHSVLKDGLLQKLGIYKTWRDSSGRTRVAAVPPEEFLFSSDARSVGTAAFVGHRREVSETELLTAGVPQDFIDEHGGSDYGISAASDADDTRRAGSGADRDAPEAGEGNQMHTLIEAYPFLDLDGDGRAELVKVWLLGPGREPVPGTAEPVAERPFDLFCPDPEPHTLVGHSWADRLRDMQDYKTGLVRATNDSASLSVFPRTAANPDFVNMQDLQNTEIGATIRTRDIAQIMPIKHDFMGAATLELARYVDEIVQRRTGRDRGTAGLDANALQSSTREGVTAVLDSAQEQAELVARIFAEMTLKPLFRRIVRLGQAEGAQPMTLRYRGELLDVNPMEFQDLDVTVNLALGTGFLDGRVNDLLMIASKQEELLQQFGPDNELVSLPQYRATLGRILRSRGFKDTTAFFKELPPDWQPPPPQPPPPTPEQVTAQAMMEIERMKSEREIEIKEAELQLKMQELELKAVQEKLQHDREMAKIEAEAALKRLDIELKYQTQVQTEEMRGAVAQNKAEGDKTVKVFDITSRQAAEEMRLEHDAEQRGEDRAAAERQAQQTIPTGSEGEE